MKLSLTLSALILVAAGFFGWQDHRKLSEARETHTRLVEEARALGLSAADLLKGDKSPRATKTQREAQGDKVAQAKAFAVKLVAFANEMKAQEKSGSPPDASMQKRIIEMIDGMMQLDAEQLKTLVAELRADPGLDDEMRNGIVGFSIMMLANDHPASALALFTESSDLFKNADMSEHIVASALSRWAQDDPMAALDWIRKNSKQHPDLVTDQTRRAVVEGAARQDPKLAFQLMGELEMKDSSNAAQNIAGAAQTSAERSALLAALRENSKNATDKNASGEIAKSTLQGLGQKLAGDGYESSAAWLASAGLTGDESKSIADGLSWWQTKGDTGKWIDWMADKLPADQLNGKVTDMVTNWTRQDYKAAGEWINGTKDGPARQTAVRSYAVTVAPYEPESAAQWAETLPAGKDRDGVVKSVYDEWAKKDKAAAEAFGKRNGLGE